MPQVANTVSCDHARHHNTYLGVLNVCGNDHVGLVDLPAVAQREVLALDHFAVVGLRTQSVPSGALDHGLHITVLYEANAARDEVTTS